MKMIDLGDIRDLVSSMFIMLNKKTYILFRIEFLVVLVTVLFVAMFIMDSSRRYIHSSIMKAIFSLFDAVSDSILIYLLGAMQTAPFRNQLFPVWALVLVIFRYSVDFISGYGVPDKGGRRFTEWRNVVKLLGSAFLNWTRGSRFARPLWSLWALQILRSWYRFHSRTLAFNSVWHGGSSKLISEYMRVNRDGSNWKPEEFIPGTMKGYKYLVYGERVKLKKPRYVLDIGTTLTDSETTKRSLITLDKIWDDIQGKDLKDLSLAFALSRLLRCRLEDVTPQEDFFLINRKLVKTRIIEEKDAKCAFGVMELHLAFVNDYFNSRYPMVFWFGLPSLFFNLLLSMVTFCVVCWLSVDIRKVYKPPKGELAHLVHGFNVDMIITWVFMFFMMFKEIWETVTYLLSDWTRLLLVCMYARWRIRNRCMERLILSFFTSKIIAKRWHGLIDQYVFAQSYDDRPKFWNLIHKVTTGVVAKKDDGAKLSSAIDVPEYVRPAILEKLGAILDHTEPADPKRNFEEPVVTICRRLPKVITTLNGDRRERYGWACFDLKTSSHVILVWHIATSFCEMELAQEHGVNLSKPGFLCSLLSCFTDCCSSKPYLLDVDEKKKEKNKEKELAQGHGIHLSNPGFLCSLLSCFTKCGSSKSNEKKDKDKLPEDLEKRYIIANSLSRYCAYLLVSKPDLIPDSFLVPKMVFKQTVKSARDVILKGCDSLESRYNKLKEEAERAAPYADNVKSSNDVVKQGAMLGKELLDHESKEECWEILAGVWAEILVHIAPTWNAEEHKKCIGSGGEFITNIWALLWHCGIEKSSLWPVDEAAENDAPVAPHDNNVGNNNIKPVGETQQAGLGGMESTGSSEIEEASQDAAVEAANAQTGMAGQIQNMSEAKKVEDVVPE